MAFRDRKVSKHIKKQSTNYNTSKSSDRGLFVKHKTFVQDISFSTLGVLCMENVIFDQTSWTNVEGCQRERNELVPVLTEHERTYSSPLSSY